VVGRPSLDVLLSAVGGWMDFVPFGRWVAARNGGGAVPNGLVGGVCALRTLELRSVSFGPTGFADVDFVFGVGGVELGFVATCILLTEFLVVGAAGVRR
jgi:hypothetical protein